MAGTQNMVEGKWTEIKGEIKKKWGQLTENDIDSTKGNFQSLVGLLEQKLGIKKDEASQHLKDMQARYSDQASEAMHKGANKVNEVIDKSKSKLKN
jgi:uncharacterized protein YjbJ (UPF0337 family)